MEAVVPRQLTSLEKLEEQVRLHHDELRSWHRHRHSHQTLLRRIFALYISDTGTIPTNALTPCATDYDLHINTQKRDLELLKKIEITREKLLLLYTHSDDAEAKEKINKLTKRLLNLKKSAQRAQTAARSCLKTTFNILNRTANNRYPSYYLMPHQPNRIPRVLCVPQV
ncbi:hypothetical protein K0U07_04920 [bacterium]|nr:hypothetical protein [bacterium]